MLEKNIMKHVMLRLSKLGATMFRDNVGVAWSGSRITRIAGGGVVIENARPIKMGLTKGSSDLIGFMPIEITDKMVGKTVAVFVAAEIKRSVGGLVSKEQRTFIDNVTEAGGIAGVVRSADEAWELLRRARDAIQSV